jgi:cysteinyl-tRNA synthetase
MTVKKENISRWINTVLVTILLAIMSVGLGRVKELNENTETLQVEMAIVAVKFDNHIDFAQDKVRDIESNTGDIRQIKETYVTREEIRDMLDDMKQYIAQVNGKKP